MNKWKKKKKKRKEKRKWIDTRKNDYIVFSFLCMYVQDISNVYENRSKLWSDRKVILNNIKWCMIRFIKIFRKWRELSRNFTIILSLQTITYFLITYSFTYSLNKIIIRKSFDNFDFKLHCTKHQIVIFITTGV